VLPQGFLFSKIPPQYDQYQHDLLVLLPMMAQATSRIRIGFNCAVAPWGHPYLWAKYMASLDVASDGRVIAGFGAGGTGGRMKDGKRFNQVLDSFGINSRKRGKMTDEALELVTRLWTSDSPVSHDGEFFQAIDLLVAPKPIQKPYPELWYAGGQSGPGTAPGIRRAARYGSQIQVPWPSENEIRDELVPQLAAANREWNGNAELGLLLNAGVRSEGAPSFEEACALYPHYAELKHPHDEPGTVLVGTPEQCAEVLQRCHRAGAAHFILDFHRHGLDGADVFRKEMERFAEQVFPLLQ
jgi:alkanesulfonate monooxygenase SsuD/methylene tetrahydromethanopterin reductase-like flavin-dependent oxidoreductase (luciferase family)